MAAGFESALSDELLSRVVGQVNVPDDCVRNLKRIQLCGARPAGVNEPTSAGVSGSKQIVRLLQSLQPHDLCVVLLSGGGSALLPAPVAGISLEDKLAVTRLLMRSGATINELNCVRSHLSDLKGGGLLQQTQAGSIVGLIISDVVGDPLDIIASGPTVASQTTATDALAVLSKFGQQVPEAVIASLKGRAGAVGSSDFSRVRNHIVGSNSKALQACSVAATELGYSVLNLGSDVEGEAKEIGVSLVELAKQIQSGRGPVGAPACILSGGEPIVNLCGNPGRGGRNQEVALAASTALEDTNGIVVLSGGTDGEDGPTDAAGGVVSGETAVAAAGLGLVASDFLKTNDAYNFLSATGSLLRTGPTDTNVMDIRVVLVAE
jgi:glycerate-2-kinase